MHSIGWLAVLAWGGPWLTMSSGVFGAPVSLSATREHVASAVAPVEFETTPTAGDSTATSEDPCLPPDAAQRGIIVLAEGAEPALSKDGKLMAFFRNETLWIMDLETRRERKILRLVNPHSASWSPDGRRLAYQAGSPFSIWLVDADGSRLRQLIAPAPGNGDQYPLWSPDGKSLVWTHGVRLWIADTSGRQARPLTRNSTARFEVACDWSPDGRTLLYSAAASLSSDSYQLRLVERGGTNDRPDLTGVFTDRARWSRSGKAIYFDEGNAFCRMEYRSGGKATRFPHGETLGGARFALAPDESFLLHDCMSSGDEIEEIILMPLR